MKVIKRVKFLDLFLGHTESLSLDDMVTLSGMNKPTVRRHGIHTGGMRLLKKIDRKYTWDQVPDFTGLPR